MAVVPDYVTGTITLTSGSANFTSTGAALQSAAVRAGDEILLPAKGLVLVIGSITGENAGTLVENCPAGAAGAAQPMRIRFQSDGSRLTAQAATLIEALANGNLAAIADLTSAADKLPYFSGPGVAAMADFKAAARALLGLTAAADKLPYFDGANSAALATFTAAGRALVGGANAAAMYATLGAVPNGNISATLTADKAFRQGNILATVAQSGGVPTGGLIESGSNANGSYARFANGTQIISRQFTCVDTGPATAAFPATFIDTSYSVGAIGNGSTSSSVTSIKAASKATNSAAFVANFVSASFPSQYVTAGIDILAIGRWF
ncbi:hypothetical protein [Mesorhizobium sp. B2-5-3]|uniref:hypothetical protein n=1 Tax=Mesorhizobium sp. B2-5-3 TaxID=2589927 RepID=UPI001127E570|nr:hypothetical protein [Mesorhizobium sp. B2-5-3]TPK38708.1 hypothetical protein FJ867_08875 [Mesorhizobium sp. B2-5-3]